MMIEENENEIMLEETHEVVEKIWSLNKKMKWQKLEDKDHSKDSISFNHLEGEDEEQSNFFMKRKYCKNPSWRLK